MILAVISGTVSGRHTVSPPPMPEPITTKSVSCDSAGDFCPSGCAGVAAVCCVAVAQEGLHELFLFAQHLFPEVVRQRNRYEFNGLRLMPYD